jgi:hypothetical protein
MLPPVQVSTQESGHNAAEGNCQQEISEANPQAWHLQSAAALSISSLIVHTWSLILLAIAEQLTPRQ